VFGILDTPRPTAKPVGLDWMTAWLLGIATPLALLFIRMELRIAGEELAAHFTFMLAQYVNLF